MTPAQLRRRETLIARSDAALERWPGRVQPEFATEMRTVAAALESLAQAMAGDRDSVELSRTWRWAGNAYFDLAAGMERHALEQAAQAYQHAEEALADATDEREQVKLNYCFGKTLLQLCDGKDLGLATEARARLQTALGLARGHMPDGVASVQADLATAESIVALLGAVKGLDHRIDELKGEIRRADARDRAAEVHAARPQRRARSPALPSDVADAGLHAEHRGRRNAGGRLPRWPLPRPPLHRK